MMEDFNITLLKQNTNGAISDFMNLCAHHFLSLIFYNQQELLLLQLLTQITPFFNAHEFVKLSGNFVSQQFCKRT